MKRFPGHHGIDFAADATRPAGAGRTAPAVAISAGPCVPNSVENTVEIAVKTMSLVPQGRAAAP